jgi:tetratricopeptide (TPR) repeat protein
VSRQALQDVYQKLLVMDLEFALDKKIEQELWNHAFKNQISTLQNQAKDKQSQKRGEVQASLNLFLETASGFYLQLLQELCSTFELDLPFRKKASCFGIMKEYSPVNLKIKLPKRSSCMYICQHCLVHLGDIARYRQQTDQAQAYYRHAARLVPYNGQPYNQLAILDAAKGNKLSTVFYYIRSIAVKHPFPVAATNLEKLYAKISKDSHEYRSKLTSSDLVNIFLQLHTFTHLCIHLTKAKSHIEKILLNLPSIVSSASFSSYQLVQMIAINLYALYHAKRRLSGCRGGAGEPGDENSVAATTANVAEPLVSHDQQMAYDLMFGFTVSVFEALLQATPKHESKAKESPTLAALKVIFDWLRSEPDVLSDPTFERATIWLNVSKLLNVLQSSASTKESSLDLQKYAKTPLPEDNDLECFLPVNRALSELDFCSTPAGTDILSDEVEVRLRCQRLFSAGFWLAEEFPSLNLLNVQRLSSGRLEFSTQLQAESCDGLNGDHAADLKTNRQSVAIQKSTVSNGTMATSGQPHDEKINRAATAAAFGISRRPNQLHKKDAEDLIQVPERSDASVMVNPIWSDIMMGGDDRAQEATWRSAADQEPVRPSVPSGYVSNIRHPLPFQFQTHPNQMSSVMFQRPPYGETCPPPSMPRGGVPVSGYDATFGSPAAFGPRFIPGGMPVDVGIQSTDISRSMGPTFDPYSGIYRCQGTPTAQHPVGIPKMYPIGQPMGFHHPPPLQPQCLPSSVYMARPPPDGTGFGNPIRIPNVSSIVTTTTAVPPSHHQWQAPNPMAPFPMFSHLMSGMQPPSQQMESSYIAAVAGGGSLLPQHAQQLQQQLQNAATGAGGGSCVSPDLELMEASLLISNPRNSSPLSQHQQITGTANFTHHRFASNSPLPLVSDFSESSGQQLAALSPGTGEGQHVTAFSRSPPIDSLQLSRSLPTTVKFGSGLLQPGSVGSDSGFFGQMPRSPFNATTPANSLFQSSNMAATSFFGQEDRKVGFKPPEDALSSPLPYSKTSGIGFGFGSQNEKRSSTGNLSSSSLFTSSDEDRQEQQLAVTNTYSLFSQSPWPLGISTGGGQSVDGTSSHRSSPFDSSNSGSLRATPDPYLSDDRSSVTGVGAGGGATSAFGGLGLFTRQTAASSIVPASNAPWRTMSTVGSSSSGAIDSAVGSGRMTVVDNSGIDMSTLTANMQSLWSGGPSPLEKLLEQQKQQRQSTPR